ncbi:MAG: hypothetical protein L0211_01880 [Planctomycetaceae bacterium]|nr:hypothetical protein [Planctomycetaceae bacterium]
MTINLSSDLSAAIADEAERLGTTPEAVVEQLLRAKLVPPSGSSRISPRDDWERRLLAIPRDCGVSLSDEALSREELYD